VPGRHSIFGSCHAVSWFSLAVSVSVSDKNCLRRSIFYFTLPALHPPAIVQKSAKTGIWDHLPAACASAGFQVLV